RLHQPAAHASPAAVRADADALDVAGAERPAAVHQATLDDGRVPDEDALLPRQCMDASKRAFPVVLGQLAFEDVVEQGTSGGQRAGGQVRGVRRGHLERVEVSLVTQSDASFDPHSETPAGACWRRKSRMAASPSGVLLAAPCSRPSKRRSSTLGMPSASPAQSTFGYTVSP